MEDYKGDFAHPRALAGWGGGGRSTSCETIANGQGHRAPRPVRAARHVRRERRPRAGGEHRRDRWSFRCRTRRARARPRRPTCSVDRRASHRRDRQPVRPVVVGGKEPAIGQGNNAFIFPGSASARSSRKRARSPTAWSLVASYALAEATIAHGSKATGGAISAKHAIVYPPIEVLRDITIRVAARVARRATLDGVARTDLPEDIEDLAARSAWSPRYLPFRRV